MFHKHDYLVVNNTNEVLRTFIILGVMFLVFGEIMYEKGKEAGKRESKNN